MSTIITKNDIIADVNEIAGINGKVIGKQELTDALESIDGIGGVALSKREVFDAIVGLDTFETRTAAQNVADIIVKLAGFNQATKTADVITKITDLGLLDAQPKGKEVVDAVINTVKTNVVAGNQVNIDKFVNFKLATQAAKPARKGRNPSTGEDMDIAASPAKRVVRIKASAPFKAAVAG